jgi:MFS family permease
MSDTVVTAFAWPTSRRDGVRAMAGAASATVGAVIPVFLLGGQSVLIGRELGFDAAGLGIAVSGFFAVSAVASVPTGRLVERFGPTVTTRVGIVLAAVSLLGIATLASSYSVLIAFLLVGGAANGLAQLGSNLSLARSVARNRQGLAFGVKQAAVPAATLVAGLAVPVIGLTIGWRWSFALAGVVVLLSLLLVPSEEADARRAGGGDHDRATAALVVMAVAAALGAGTANALGAFLVSSAVDRGVGAALAGLTLSLGGAVGVVVRVLGGWLADRRDGGHLAVVGGMLASGAAGLALLAVPSAWALILGTILGFGLGWSWPGVLTFAVVRLNPTAPAAATGITQAGVYAGGGFGPLAFGALVHVTSYPFAWLAAAVVMVLAAALMLVGRGMLIRRRAASATG